MGVHAYADRPVGSMGQPSASIVPWPSFFEICSCQWLLKGQECRDGSGRPGDSLLGGRLRDSERTDTCGGEEAAACRRLRQLRRLGGRCAFALCRGTVFSAVGHWPSWLCLPFTRREGEPGNGVDAGVEKSHSTTTPDPILAVCPRPPNRVGSPAGGLTWVLQDPALPE